MSSTNNLLVNKIFDVKGKVALVSGGGSGIGLMATQALAANGAKVYIIGRREEKLDTVVKIHGQEIAGEISSIPADITNKSDISKLVQIIESKEGHLDILINNAGIAGNSQEVSANSADEMKENLFDNEGNSFEDWCNTYSTNVAQIFFMTMAFLPLLQKATELQHGYSATVINISSISGIIQLSQGHFSYNASKAASIHLNKMLASEISRNNVKVRVNTIAPGVFPSEMTTNWSGPDQKSYIGKDEFNKISSRRPGKDEDMASAVLFAATNQYLNGVTIPVDGGYILSAGA